ncbi:hypothetical protein DFQ07_1886 [Tenacibaculum caenipelagi]|uniref:Uncharacterized protein n=1 Tax=Tenacibaculum caenipelagi TaxID=1325435 RepID=A0A4R6TCG8_9FLAO|nr:hypothetical protein DFQ07_1886 [Tenacibaculum caenipelagi]
MENNKLEILFKLLWVGLTLFTIYIFSWLSFIYLTFGNFETNQYNSWNLLIPNILTIGLLIFYAKEILIGYKPTSTARNLKSLLIFSTLIIILTIIQIPQFKLLFDSPKSKSWQIILSLIIILTCYVGIITNRILRIKELKNNS